MLEEAIEKVSALPKERQAYADEVLEHIAAAGNDAFVVPGEHRAAVLEGLAQAKRGEVVSDSEFDEILSRPWT